MITIILAGAFGTISSKQGSLNSEIEHHTCSNLLQILEF